MIADLINYCYNKWFKQHIENENAKWFKEYEFADMDKLLESLNNKN